MLHQKLQPRVRYEPRSNDGHETDYTEFVFSLFSSILQEKQRDSVINVITTSFHTFRNSSFSGEQHIYILECATVQSARLSLMFLRSILQSFSESKIEVSKRTGKHEAELLCLFACLISGLKFYSSTLMMESVHSSKMQLNFYQSARCHIP